jgi:hypothetical protein
VADVQPALQRAVHFLVRRTRQDGRFIYLINLDPSIPVADTYNLVRHAGVLYALGEYHRRTPDPEVRQSMEIATKFLVLNIGRIPGRPDLAAIWSPDASLLSGEAAHVKLGSCGLGLAALTHWERMAPGDVPARTRESLARFMGFMQGEDGRFYSRYVPHLGGPDRNWESLYYPGEAALGLVMLYEMDGNRRWLDTAERALGYLADSRRDVVELPHDHWTLIATGRLLAEAQRRGIPVNRQRLMGHANRLCRTFMAVQVQDDPRIAGAFDLRGQTTPCATRLEGLIAIRPWLEQPLRGEVEASIRLGIDFLLRAQKNGERYVPGAVPYALERLPQDHPRYSPAFNQRATEVRMDYQQHFISALLGYLDWQDPTS